MTNEFTVQASCLDPNKNDDYFIPNVEVDTSVHDVLNRIAGLLGDPPSYGLKVTTKRPVDDLDCAAVCCCPTPDWVGESIIGFNYTVTMPRLPGTEPEEFKVWVCVMGIEQAFHGHAPAIFWLTWSK